MRILMAVLVVLLVALQFQLWREWQHVRELDARLAEQQQSNAALKARNDALFAEVQDLREGLDAIEERARSELGLVGEDESFYLIVDPELAAENEASTPRPAASPTPGASDEPATQNEAVDPAPQ